MTEMFGKWKSPQPLGPRYAIDPVAFFKALFLAPLLVAGLGFWALGIPVFAVTFGGPFYLLLGTPVLMIHLQRNVGEPEKIAGLAITVVAVPLLLFALVSGIAGFVGAGRPTDAVAWITLAGVSVIHAGLWGLAFGTLYNRWRNAASRRPVPPFFTLAA